jgi:hypothetical protein
MDKKFNYALCQMTEDFKRSLFDGFNKVEQRFVNNEDSQKQIIEFCQRASDFFSHQTNSAMPINIPVNSHTEELSGLRDTITFLQ